MDTGSDPVVAAPQKKGEGEIRLHVLISLCNPLDVRYQYPSMDDANLFLFRDGVLVGGWCSSKGNDSARWAAEAIKALHPDHEIAVRLVHPEAGKWWESVKRLNLTNDHTD